MTDTVALYALDIETDTSPVSDEERSRGFTVRGLDPRVTRVVALSVATRSDDGVLVAKVWNGNEPDILVATQNWLAAQRPGLIVTWNGSVFDLPFVDSRARQLGVDLDLELTPDPRIIPKYQSTPGYEGGYSATWAGHRSVDVAYAVREAADRANITWSLKPFARWIGLDPVEVNRGKIHELSPAELDEYVASDALVTHLVAEKEHPLLVKAYPDLFEAALSSDGQSGA